MGSLRNPVGPLPSSIYWRRRAVVLSVVAVLVLLVVWAVTSSGGGGKNKADGSNGKHPTSSITPGPSGTGPAISQRPGGRDESGGGDGSGSSGGAGSSGSGASGGAGDTGSGGTDGQANGSGGSSGRLPAGGGASLPDCASGSVQLTLRSLHNTYGPGDTPTFELIAKNTSGSDCKVDLGPKYAVLTITQAGSNSAFWSSADCPSGSGGALFRVPANEQVTYTVKWDRKHSAPNCATPPAGSAAAGTYLVEARVPGFPKTQTSFVLSKD
ncbi:hypothetical protein ACFYZJ_34740 [Streptomyces sp. NPDC001848]|uniref:hypothetical protein n=1 Tax=Streptomyces sp. NPDC001848 TaxID=3364618 RepID=UPI0036A7BC9C